MNNKEVRTIAFYLPQFHPIPENDDWWGKGFTEWTNVGRAKPLFRKHYQPRVPADLGYYDLRLSETRELQAQMAKDTGINGFAYWHYWFAGKRLLEKPFQEVVKSKKPNFPFCLAWANTTWTGIWNNDHNRILIKQTYPGVEDHKAHFYSMLEAFSDERYLKYDDRLIFLIYRPFELPNPKEFITLWNELAIQNGFKGFYFIGISNNPTAEFEKILEMGFDAMNPFRVKEAIISVSKTKYFFTSISRRLFSGKTLLTKYNYLDVINYLITSEDLDERVLPTLLPNWDTSPRSGTKALILYNSKPEFFERHLQEALKVIDNKKNKLLFLKSWNEWAEGNYVEPDLKYGTKYIDILRKNLG